LNGKYYKNIKLTIFNRWGEVVFYTENDNFIWNGTIGSNGGKLTMGIYPYILEYSVRDTKYQSQRYVMKGAINIIR
jgi:gliding motility-associated-like protein